MQNHDLTELLKSQTRIVCDGEKKLQALFSEVASTANDGELLSTLKNHAERNRKQIRRLEDALTRLRVEQKNGSCTAMDGMIQEGREVLANQPDTAVRDVALISMLQRIYHYQIAAYGSLATYADRLDHDDIADLLGANLNAEKEMDTELSKIATGGLFSSGVNEDATRPQ